MGSDPARRARQRAVASFVAAAVCFAAAAGIVAVRHGPGHRFRDAVAMREWGWEGGPARGWDDDGDGAPDGGRGGRPGRDSMPPLPSMPSMPAMPRGPGGPSMPPMPGGPGRDRPVPVPASSTTTAAPGAPEGN